MSRGVQMFKQTDVAKALKAAKSVGLKVQRYEIDRDGKIVIVTGRAASQGGATDEGENPWNDVA